MTNLRTGAVGGAISGRHCLSERAIVKTATAPDLSLRGGRRPTWQSREGTSSSYKVPIKTYQPIASVAALTAQPLAALPPYGCGVPLAGSERLAGWQYSGHVFYGMRPPSLSFRGAKRRGNLKQALTISPGLSCVPGVYCEIAAAPAEPRNDKLGGLFRSKERNDKAGRLARFSYSSPFSSVLEIASTPMTRLPSSMRMRMTPWVSRP